VLPTVVRQKHRDKILKWLNFLYVTFFRVIGFFYRIYTANRARAESFKSREKVSLFIKFMSVLILVGWLLVWYFASEESRTGLIDEVKQSIGQ